jgi:hypothetical protein
VATSLSAQIHEAISKTHDTYYKLILAVGTEGTGKTSAVKELAEKNNWARINVNIRLSEKLLELTHRQRAARVAAVLNDTVRCEKSEVLLLDNIELLFAVELAQDPLKLLQTLSRNQTIVAAWPGHFDGTALTYADAGHPEARRYTKPQAVIVKASETDQSGAGSETR